jgi:thiamine kinase-like enzyme
MLSDSNLTFCHGDVKSPNIFYKKINKSENQSVANQDYAPYFIDWQYITNGKGVQDLVFFMIESFDIDKMKLYKSLFKEYYYIKIIGNGIHYNREDYENDFKNASYYFPFFVAVWFGTISEDELIDKSFPFEFIKKLFNFYSIGV